MSDSELGTSRKMSSLGLNNFFKRKARGSPYSPDDEMKYEALRIHTFKDHAVSFPLNMARKGFYYAGEGDTIICFSCGLRVSGWENQYGKSRFERFMTAIDTELKSNGQKSRCAFVMGSDKDNIPIEYNQSPDPPDLHPCPFLTTPDQHETGHREDDHHENFQNIPNCATGHGNQPNLLIEDATAGFETVNSSGDLPTAPDVATKGTASAACTMLHEQCRRDTFQDKDCPFDIAKDLARCGFYFLRDDIVKCAFCEVEIALLETGDPPKERHKKAMPSCKLLRQTDETTGNVPIVAQQQEPFEGQPREPQNGGPQQEQGLTSTHSNSEMLQESQAGSPGQEQALSSTCSTSEMLKESQAESPGQEQALSSTHSTSEMLQESQAGSPGQEQALSSTRSTSELVLNGGSGHRIRLAWDKASETEILPTTCKVCMDDNKTACVIFLPCQHQVTCKECYQKLQHETTTPNGPEVLRCSICRANVEQSIVAIHA